MSTLNMDIMEVIYQCSKIYVFFNFFSDFKNITFSFFKRYQKIVKKVFSKGLVLNSKLVHTLRSVIIVNHEDVAAWAW